MTRGSLKESKEALTVAYVGFASRNIVVRGDNRGERRRHVFNLECQECRCRCHEASGVSLCMWTEEVVEEVKFLL